MSYNFNYFTDLRRLDQDIKTIIQDIIKESGRSSAIYLKEKDYGILLKLFDKILKDATNIPIITDRNEYSKRFSNIMTSLEYQEIELIYNEVILKTKKDLIKIFKNFLDKMTELNAQFNIYYKPTNTSPVYPLPDDGWGSY